MVAFAASVAIVACADDHGVPATDDSRVAVENSAPPSASAVPPVSGDTTLPVVTHAPLLDFEREYIAMFGADEISELRAAHPEYADVPMPRLGTLDDGTHFTLRGYVTQDDDRIVDALLFETGADSPRWTLTSAPAQRFDCVGGTVTSIRGDEHACRYGIGWQWSELGRTWRLEGSDKQLGDEFVARLVLL